MSARLKRLKNIVGEYTSISNHHGDGKYGHAWEDLISEKLSVPINRGTGPDIQVPGYFDGELKSITSRSTKITLGTLSKSEILSGKFSNNTLRRLRATYIVGKIDEHSGEVQNVSIFELTEEDIRELEETFAKIAPRVCYDEKTIIFDESTPYVDGVQVDTYGSPSLRVSKVKFRQLEQKALNNYDDLFEVIHV